MIIWVNSRAIEFESVALESLHTLLARRGYGLSAPCGGGGRCGKCRVRVENAWEPTPIEKDLLSPQELAKGFRLACQTFPLDGMRISFEEVGKRPAHIATEGQSVSYPFSPSVKLKSVQSGAPAITDQKNDLARLARACKRRALEASTAVLARLPLELRSHNWTISAVLKGNRLLGLNPRELFGVAVDIGTTTIACYLLDLQTGKELAVASALNPQKAHGDDVISRCDYARSGGLKKLQAEAAGAVDTLIGQMCAEAGVRREDIFHTVIAGNTVMLHLFAGVSPEHIALSPFIPAFTGVLECNAAELGLQLNPEAVATLLPSVAGYVGADIVAGMLACGMREDDEPALLLDIGTNGEIVLAAGGGIYACSTAAGPAFEGAHIACGMGGVAGAINKVEMNGGIRYSTIGNMPAQGICGSGLMDLIAGLLDCGAIDDTGKLCRDAAPKWLDFDGDAVWVDRAAGIKLTGKDIREVQLAKAAIAAGVEVLVQQAGLQVADIKHVYLAGGFGSYMDRHSACRVGLIPKALENKAIAVGNSAGAGAKAALLSVGALKEARRLARAVKYIELSACKEFQGIYIDKMLFD